MKNIGFIIGEKKNEKRRAIIPEDLKNIRNIDKVFIEKKYGEVLGVTDEEYKKYGAKIVSREEILKKDIICDPKIGDSNYLYNLKKGQIAFGWIHGVQNYKIAQSFIDNVSTGIAWEDMFEDGRHVFWKNNEIAGEAAILHAFQLYGKFPENMKVAILGRGNIARGAKKILDKLGANVQVYDQKTEKKFNEELENYEVIVNAILWDTTRKDHIIYREDLKRMKKGSMIIDISCDRNGAIETSIPTNLEEPIYYEEGILHYVVDHTPTIFFKSTTIAISNEVKKYIDDLIEENTNEILKKATIIKEGVIIDKRIKEFQKRK